VHLNIERRLIGIVGNPAAPHTARSRNDQVATDLRLWLRDAIDRHPPARQVASEGAARSGAKARRYRDAGIHPPAGRPAGDLRAHLLAYFEMLERDHARLADCADE